MSRITGLVRSSILVFAAASVSAVASDGVLEISQACATSAQGCFAGDVGGGFPVEVTQAGSYRLTSNLVLANANQTAISASAVGTSFDLNGFTIKGVTVCSGSPVTNCAPTGGGIGVSAAGEAVVMNGRIVGMGSYGVALGARSRVQDLHVTSSGLNGIFVGDQCVVTNAIVFSTGEIGIVAGFGSVVSDSTSTNNKLDGVVLASGTLQSVTATANGRNGAQMFFGSFAHNDLGGNAVASIIPGNAHASAGNSCPDGRCSYRGTRRFYMTKGTFTGGQALTACAAGYHMASRWELLDVSGLEYDTLLGRTEDDSGRGPTWRGAWARTGVVSETLDGFAFPNCAVWTSSSQSHLGMTVYLNVGTVNSHPELGVEVSSCNQESHVWCMED